MISAMPLMPMPPMPIKWIVPTSSGTRVVTVGLMRPFARVLDRIGNARGAVGFGNSARGCSALRKIVRRREGHGQHLGQLVRASVRTDGCAIRHRRWPARRHSESDCRQAHAAAAREWQDGRSRISSTHRAGTGTRDDQMCLGHADRQVAEKGRELGLHAGSRHRPRALPRYLRHGIAGRFPDASCRSVDSIAIAGGTISLKARAPWLPPNTRSRSGPFAAACRKARRPAQRLPAASGLPVSTTLATCPSARTGRWEELRPSASHCSSPAGWRGRARAFGVDDRGRHARQDGRQHHRHAGIAAEADHRRGPDARSSLMSDMTMPADDLERRGKSRMKERSRRRRTERFQSRAPGKAVA